MGLLLTNVVEQAVRSAARDCWAGPRAARFRSSRSRSRGEPRVLIEFRSQFSLLTRRRTALFPKS